MKALCWHGTGDVRVDTVADPTIQDPRDIVIKITSTAICGSDLHLFNGFQPTMEKGDQLGHENMGEVIEVGSLLLEILRGGRRVHDLLRGVLLLSEGSVRLLRPDEPQRGDGEGRDGSITGRTLRVLTHDGRLRGRSGRVLARAVCRRGPYQDS